MRRAKVCTRPGCPHLRPCPTHDGQHTGWSPGRNRNLQAKFRRLVLNRDRHTCRRCGLHDPTGQLLEAHHLQAGYTVDCGITLCTSKANGCHKQEDPNAR